MIDVHCHYDMAKKPEQYISENERKKIVTIGMTNLPSHFQMGRLHVRKYKFVRLALGLHPLLATEHAKEYEKFREFANETTYIGEVGLDFSREGMSTKEIQLRSFGFVLDCIKQTPKVISLHSRRAEKEVLRMLQERNIQCAIFHWYSGPLKILSQIVEAGYYFSINSAMINSTQGRRIVNEIPNNRLLTETDFPYVEGGNIHSIHVFLSQLWEMPVEETEKLIHVNFKKLMDKIADKTID